MPTMNEPQPDAPGGGAAVETPPPPPAPPPEAKREPKRTPPRLDELPPFKVLLHNDDINSMDYVLMTLCELFRLEPGRAAEIMFEAHDTGVALVMVSHKERAELAQEQLTSKRLVSTIEPA